MMGLNSLVRSHTHWLSEAYAQRVVAALTHAWVNAEFMLDACMVGFLVSEPSS